MKKFEAQLPDAIDLIARSLKAGHAFSTGLKMIADEFDDPIGPEFSMVIDEINFGTGFSDAMKNLSSRVDCPDMKFFIIAVILQRETGGKLAEIIENISYIIRERFKLKNKVRAISAEGRISMMILVLLPFALLSALYLINPEYIMTLFVEPTGKIMVTIAGFMMMLGVIIMKKMINIKV
ncbi:type II secretion system F family protein [Candidatus Parcubacteria bacterium]|nr:type II secretion system F family protein [Candidatus Parcubacteria bacterium]